MIPFNKKEVFMLQLFKNKFEGRLFEETDVSSFLIFMRSHFEGNENNQFSYICDCCDCIAHRRRDAGKAATSVANAITNNYQTKTKSPQILGYDGIRPEQWKTQWDLLGKTVGIVFSDEIIREITLCVMSILQFSEYYMPNKRRGQAISTPPISTMYLVQGNNELSLCTCDDKSTNQRSLFIVYCQLKDVSFQKEYHDLLIKDATYARRENGVLRLINEKGEYII